MFQQLSVLFFSVFLFSSPTWAWGKRGHEMVGSLAAQLLVKEHPQGKFLLPHSFDMGYYNNVPDLVWKADPETYKKEVPQHYLDMEIFEKEFAKKKETSPWNPSRAEFFKKFPDIPEKAGRSPWRIQELSQKLKNITQQLQKKSLNKKERHALQEQWLVTAGVMGHYIADLAQPMHVTDNHDGQLTGQKGLHHWFEENIVDELHPSLAEPVFQKARAEWKAFYDKNAKKSSFDLALELAQNSHTALPRVLDIDKKQGRTSESKVAGAYKDLLIERLSTAVLYLALLWNQNLGWDYNGDRFFNFVVAPPYIEPSN